MIDPVDLPEPRPSDELTEAQLRDFYDDWAMNDGNSPGYNNDKAKLYSRIGRWYRCALEEIRGLHGDYLTSKVVEIVDRALAPKEFPRDMAWTTSTAQPETKKDG